MWSICENFIEQFYLIGSFARIVCDPVEKQVVFLCLLKFVPAIFPSKLAVRVLIDLLLHLLVDVVNPRHHSLHLLP